MDRDLLYRRASAFVATWKSSPLVVRARLSWRTS